MGKIFSAAGLIMGFLFAPVALSDILHCTGEITFMEQQTPVRIDIVLPVENNLNVTLVDNSSELLEVLVAGVGKGVIEIQYAGEPERHVFIQTRKGSEKSGISLVGFYVDRTYVHVVRVDVWKTDKPFYFLDPFLSHSKIITGNCD